MKYCMQCGNPLPDEAVFCARCGAQQEEVQQVYSQNNQHTNQTFGNNLGTELFKYTYPNSQVALLIIGVIIMLGAGIAIPVEGITKSRVAVLIAILAIFAIGGIITIIGGLIKKSQLIIYEYGMAYHTGKETRYEFKYSDVSGYGIRGYNVLIETFSDRKIEIPMSKAKDDILCTLHDKAPQAQKTSK